MLKHVIVTFFIVKLQPTLKQVEQHFVSTWFRVKFRPLSYKMLNMFRGCKMLNNIIQPWNMLNNMFNMLFNILFNRLFNIGFNMANFFLTLKHVEQHITATQFVKFRPNFFIETNHPKGRRGRKKRKRKKKKPATETSQLVNLKTVDLSSEPFYYKAFFPKGKFRCSRIFVQASKTNYFGDHFCLWRKRIKCRDPRREQPEEKKKGQDFLASF